MEKIGMNDDAPKLETANQGLIVIGIDPGPKTSALLAADYGPHNDKGLRLNYVGAEVDNWAVRRAMYDLRERCAVSGSKNVIVIFEMVACYGMAVGKEVFETVRWIGRFEEIIAGHVDYRTMYRMQVKMALCGQARAKDENIRARLIEIWGEPGKKKNPGVLFGVAKHSWAALALVTTYLMEQKLMFAPEIVPQ